MAENTSSGTDKVVVFAGENLYGLEVGQKLYVDQETADFLVEHGHATLPKSKQ